MYYLFHNLQLKEKHFYFESFPKISYNNIQAIDITRRAIVEANIIKDQSAFYPYTLSDGETADSLAYDYYGDANYVWIIYFVNNIVDPYYDVPLTQEQFDAFIIKKYGSLAKANQTIKFYRNNYYEDDSILTISGYEALNPERKRYWTPTVNYDNNIIGYERIQDDTVVTTNKIISIEITANTALTVGEKVIQTTSGASAYIEFSNTSQLTLKHVNGQFSNSYTIVGQDSAIIATPTSSVITLIENVSANVAVYFSPVTDYDYERGLNDKKKNVKLIDNRYTATIEASFIEAMSA